jgi:hypothetical protein
LEQLRSNIVRIGLPVTILLLFLLAFLRDDNVHDALVSFFVEVVPAAAFAALIVWFISAAPTRFKAFLRAVACFLAMALVVLAIVLSEFFISEAYIGFYLFAVIMTVLALVILVPMLLAPFVAVYCAIAVVFTVEFVVRRVVEYPKGPVFGLAALMTAIGGILTAF